MDDESTILSVGIDIGTSTTQVIFSRLTFKNSAGYFSVPHIAIVDKKVVYQSDIYRTPLVNRSLIDGSGVRDIVAAEFAKAGYSPSDTQTGAVIITGESARKENSEIVLNELSRFAGEFVVSTAGPDLEAIIAGKGSGARQYSVDEQCRVVNLDIGGGTTNAVIFDCGEVVGKGCLDIGGRLITIDDAGYISYLSDSVKKIAAAANIRIQVGDRADIRIISKVAEAMAQLLLAWLNHEITGLLLDITTPGSTPLDSKGGIRAICFSGGVADCIYGDTADDWRRYGDMGVVLGKAIRQSPLTSNFRLIEAKETIRATVVGAGSYTTSVSGSTITYNRDVFPLKNVPVLKLSEEEQSSCFDGRTDMLRERLGWMQQQSDSRQIVLAMKGRKNPSYLEMKRLAAVLTEVLDALLDKDLPMIIILECDIAKALGQMMLQLPARGTRDIICIDSIQVDQNDFVDMGKPLMNGMVIPVVVKTLIFG